MNRFEHGGNIYEMAETIGTTAMEWVDFSANINPLGPSKIGLKTMESAYRYISAYPDPNYKRLTQAVATYLKTQPQYLFMNNGAIEGLHEVLRFLKPKKALLVTPCFVEYEKALIAQGTEVHFYELSFTNHFKLNLEVLTQMILSIEPNVLILCTPNNPTGQSIDFESLISVVNVLKSVNSALVLDEAFIEFQGQDASVLVHNRLFEATQFHRLFISRSFTKFFGVPGLRLGALKSYDEAFSQWRVLNGVPWNINVFAEHYAYGALEDYDYHHKTISYVNHAKTIMLESLEQIDGITCISSLADYLLIKVHKKTTLEYPMDLRAYLLQFGIMIRSCSNYRGLDEHYYRIAVKTIEQNTLLIEKIREYVKDAS